MFGCSQVRFTTRTMLFLTENFDWRLNFFLSNAEEIAPLCLIRLLLRMFPYYSFLPKLITSTFENSSILDFTQRVLLIFTDVSEQRVSPNLKCQTQASWSNFKEQDHIRLDWQVSPKRLWEFTTTLHIIQEPSFQRQHHGA